MTGAFNDRPITASEPARTTQEITKVVADTGDFESMRASVPVRRGHQSDYETEVMGASFRNTGKILDLSGCDALTISPDLMKELSESDGRVERKLDPAKAKDARVEKLELDEKKFRYLLNENAMATKKTAEDIRKFAADMVKLEKVVASKIDH